MAELQAMKRDIDKVPVIDDPRPRVALLSIPMDLSQSALEAAWLLLKPMAEARGFRNMNMRDAEIFAPSTYDVMAAKLASQNSMKLHLVPCPMLKTNYTWLIKFGSDTVLSVPLN